MTARTAGATVEGHGSLSAPCDRTTEGFDMTDRTLVLATFANEAAADAAADALGQDETTDRDAIGVLALDSKGKLKVDKVGARTGGKGAGVGAALWLLGPVGMVAGVAGGAAVGALHHKGLKLDDSDRDRITSELADGKAAVGALVREEDVSAVSSRLPDLGGPPEAQAAVSEDELEASASEQESADEPATTTEPATAADQPAT